MRLLPTPGGRPHTRGVSSVETRDHERAALRQRGGAHGRVDEVPHGGVALQRVCVQLSRHLHPTQCGLPPPSTADCEQAGASCGRKRLSRYPSAEQVHGEPDVRNPSAKYQATLSLSLSLSLSGYGWCAGRSPHTRRWAAAGGVVAAWRGCTGARTPRSAAAAAASTAAGVCCSAACCVPRCTALTAGAMLPRGRVLVGRLLSG
jgi:hypothetical protein